MKCLGSFELLAPTWCSANPGLFIFTIDQSMDMKVNYSDSKKRAEFAAELVNRYIEIAINRNINELRVKNCCYITVLGYASQVKVLCEGWLPDLCKSPKRIEQIVRKVPDGEGGLMDIEERISVWIDSETCDNKTDLFILTTEIQRIVNSWRKDNDTIPIVINLTAGIHSDIDVQRCSELKDCLVCNVLCKPDKEISDDERLFWETHSSSHIPETIIDAMKMYECDISSLSLDSSMLYAFIRTPFYSQGRAMFTL